MFAFRQLPPVGRRETPNSWAKMVAKPWGRKERRNWSTWRVSRKQTGRPWNKSSELFASVFECWFVLSFCGRIYVGDDFCHLFSLQKSYSAILVYLRLQEKRLPVYPPVSFFQRTSSQILINGVSYSLNVTVYIAGSPSLHFVCCDIPSFSSFISAGTSFGRSM